VVFPEKRSEIRRELRDVFSYLTGGLNFMRCRERSERFEIGFQN
jgi:hypothetical protein